MKKLFIMLLAIDCASVAPKESLRFRYTLEQGYDTSCGMSVVATALDLYWGVPATEAGIIAAASGGAADLVLFTVSLADMAAAFAAHGVAARAFKLDWEGLTAVVAKGYSPIVVHYERPERHFALLLGFRDGRAVTADPARGLESLSREAFGARYSGSAMALASKALSVDGALVDRAIAEAAGRHERLESAASRFALREGR